MILDEIAAKTKQRVQRRKEQVPFEAIQERALALGKREDRPFLEALKKEGMSFICEVKKASPSKGVIAEAFPYLEIAKEYQAAGADAISVLTEPDYFLGSDMYLRNIKQAVACPVLRKDFTVDAYQIYEAKTLGADAVLLICSLLEEKRLYEFLGICDCLGLSALVEAHDAAELQTAVRCGAKILGVNNRNLKDFTVDIANSIRLRELAPPSVAFVAESGMKTRADIVPLERAGVNAVLIGETLMRAADKGQALAELRGAYDQN